MHVHVIKSSYGLLTISIPRVLEQSHPNHRIEGLVKIEHREMGADLPSKPHGKEDLVGNNGESKVAHPGPG